MRKVYLIVLSTAISYAALGQGVYLSPDAPYMHGNDVRLYVDISSPECGCELLADADPISNPLYIWTWQPAEDRPDYLGMNLSNGDWNSSNVAMQMSRDESNPNLWYYDFAGLSPVEFYGLDSDAPFYETGIHFLVKFFDASGDPEPKSMDLSVTLSSETSLDVSGFDIELELFASGFTRACDIVNDGTGGDRLFVVEQPGFIRILNPDASVNGEPFLNIQSAVQSSGSEQGLLGLAFSPNYAEDGHFFVNYTFSQGGQLRTRISRFSVSDDDPNLADPDSEVFVLDFAQDFGNHNGGQIEFGPDGYLYIASGDGGSGGDPNNRAQNITSYLGKMLRIDVSELPYTSPEDNPFFGDDFGLDEIWAYGLRNPWKFAFDEETGDLYMGDVGQNAREEVNFEPADFEGGGNYGWRCYEGTQPYNLNGCNAPEYIEPIMDYAYGSQGNGFRCSITGGRVYRGSAYPNLVGKYIATDYCSGEYWVLWQDENGWNEFLSEFTLPGSLVAFGTDADQELYAVRGGNSGAVYKVRENCSLLEPAVLTMNDEILAVSLEGETYAWFLDGDLIEGATSMEYEPQVNGTYQVQVLSGTGCVSLSNEWVVETLSLRNTALARIGLFPNPASHTLRVVPHGEWAEVSQAHLTLYTVDGRAVRQTLLGNPGGEGYVIDVMDFRPGFYLLELRSEGLRGVATFVKQ